MFRRLHEFLYALLLRVPIFSELLAIVNGYVYGGDHRALVRLAPFMSWVRRLGPKLLISAIFAWWITDKLTCHFTKLPDSSTKLTDMLIGIFPNLLGFGIGVYALIFALPESFFKSLRGEKDAIPGSVTEPASGKGIGDTPSNMINVDMAYPLVVIAGSIMYGAFVQFFLTINTLYVVVLLLTYCFVLMLELISLIYFSAYKTISDRHGG
ncbi:hypothetical protein [Paraburkholderia fungorum]|uniref:Uncharacterized protein n=1 Tax=Paraburkholderia fungorum TaxID=134537 RepID=A0AAW3UZT4_9BURK|nr:hypothetical protein [Paraburkholderia fungorum]MBB4515711.1 hypothetical protein [Paraburkholderia fungorum]MBB6203873.1 hypothetical protein [Paraburkholderia fungorum]